MITSTALESSPVMLGDRMLAVRRALGLNRVQMARRIQVPSHTLYNYERGGTRPIPATARKLAAGYGDWIIGYGVPRKMPHERVWRNNSKIIARMHKLLRRQMAVLHPDRRGPTSYSRQAVYDMVEKLWSVVRDQ